MPLSPRTLRPANTFTPRSISGLALWLDASASGDLYTTDAGPVVPVSSPTEISGCVLWLDGADNATITASGGLVSQWTDKSASGAVLTASGSARPTLSSTGFNSRQAIVFNGTSTNMASVSPYTATNGLSGMTRIAVCAHTTNTVSALARVYDGGSDFFLYMNGSARTYVSSGGNFVSFSPNGSTSILPAGLYADTYSASALSFYSSGAGVSGTVNGTISATTGSGSPTLHIGSNIGANFFWNGPVAEVVYFNRALTAAELARVEAYLAAKWGISGVHAPATAASDPVGYWRDRSGNGRHLVQPTSSPRPVVGTQGSRRSLSLNGTSQWMRQERTNYRMRTQFLVWRRAGTPAAFSSPFGAKGNIDATLGGSAYVSSDAHSLTYSVSSTGSHYWASNAAANRPSLVRYQGAEVNPTAFSTFGQGTFVAPDTSVINVVYTDFPTASTGNKSFFAGVEPFNAARLYPAQLLEVLQYTESLTASQVRQIERYLAAKWGIALAPQVSNADAQDWINRVYANGGTVTASTAAAVNQFCLDIENAPGGSIRDRFYRMSLMCGGTSGTAVGLNSALVPLYRGPSLGGTQYGNATDTNAGNLFVGSNYNETGASGGLLGNGSTQYLDTGIAPSNLPSYTSAHISVYHSQPSGASQTRAWIACRDTSTASIVYLSNGMFNPQSAVFGQYMSNATANYNTGGSQTGAAGGLRVLSRTAVDRMDNYYGDVSQANSTINISGGIAGVTSTRPFFVFANNNQGTADSFMNGRVMAYSIGLGLSQPQVAAYNAAMQAFQTALQRNV